MANLPVEVVKILEILKSMGAKAYLIGARALIMHGVLARGEDIKTL
ncbi:hypothetical protein [Pyrococcus abyssi]|uniref:Uncharacterized protein n=1 Tax=Pyrococcus abyssi (strain GE5 / Orsay) TaxID=272844 RepID=G8ZI94_PYRAB|nr:hypothetical protein [Pyrococcus abyssi]CCE70335.1 TPA: hypothetical protein PAB0621.1n [Pyrococcus abyssi GE5]